MNGGFGASRSWPERQRRAGPELRPRDSYRHLPWSLPPAGADAADRGDLNLWGVDHIGGTRTGVSAVDVGERLGPEVPAGVATVTGPAGRVGVVKVIVVGLVTVTAEAGMVMPPMIPPSPDQRLPAQHRTSTRPPSPKSRATTRDPESDPRHVSSVTAAG